MKKIILKGKIDNKCKIKNSNSELKIHEMNVN